MSNLKIKKLNNRGAAMMVAVVIIGILMIFCFSLLLVSYTLFASQSKKTASFRNSQAANSLSKALETELKDVDAATNSMLWRYLRCNACNNSAWAYYDPSKPGHDKEHAFRYFNLKYAYKDAYVPNGSLEGYPSEVKLCVYWCLPKDVEITNDAELEGVSMNGAILHIDIICETASQSYVINNEYKLNIRQYSSEEDEVKEQKMIRKMSGTVNNAYNPKGVVLSDAEEPMKWSWEFVCRE